MLIPDMDRTLYRSRPGLNPSSIAAGLVGTDDVDPRLIRDALTEVVRQRTPAQQDALDRGTLAHLALLQPERLDDSVAVWRGGRRQGAEWDAFEDANAGRIILKADDYQQTMRTINTLRSLRTVADSLRDISPEVAMFVRDCGIDCKGQVDAVKLSDQVIIDVKTTSTELSDRAVNATIRRFKYREKMALYCRWIAMLTSQEQEEGLTIFDEWRCYNLFLGIGGHIGARLVRLSTAALQWGEKRMVDAINKYKSAAEAGTWPIYEREGIVSVDRWEMEEEEVDVDFTNC